MPIILEEAALQSVGSGIPVDRWPCFTLKSVSVFSESTKELVSLFSGHKNHALTVTGYLQEIPEDQAHLVLDLSCTHASSRFIVKNVTSWTCARSPSDGSVEFCAIGKAGKYLIKTCDRLYDSVFAQMSETASMFNFIEARLRNMRKSVSDLSDSYVNNYDRITFSEYMNSASNCLKRQSIEDVRAGFHEYAEYIITMMLAQTEEGGSERLDWESSPMMRYFKRKCPEQNSKVRSRMNPTGPVKLSFRPNFQRQEPTPARKRTKKPVPEEGEFDTADPTLPPRDSGTEGPDTVRRSTRRATLRTKTSLDDAVESNRSSSSRERNPNRPGKLAAKPRIKNEQKRPPARTWDEIRQQELAADPEPYTYPPSNYVRKTLVRFEFPTEEPQGPGGLWTCEFRGCGFREHATDTPEGLERLRKHLQENHEGVEEVVPATGDLQQPSAFGNHTRRLAPELLEERERDSYRPSLRTNNAPPTNQLSSFSSAGNVARSSGPLLDAENNIISSIPNISSAQRRAAPESLAFAAARASSAPHQTIGKSIATDPSYHLSSARNLTTTTPTITTINTTSGAPRNESGSGPGPSSSRRQTTRGLSGNIIQPSSSPSLTLSSNTRNFATSEVVSPDDGNTALPAPSTTRAPPRHRGVMRRY